jgi:hypothetical protein
MNMSPYHLRIWNLSIALILIWGAAAANLAQEGSKSIKSEEYLAKRPTDTPAGGLAGSSANSPTTKRPAAGTSGAGGRERSGASARNKPASGSFVYIVDKSFPEGPPPRNYEYVRIGVTIWRLSPSQCPIQNCPVPNSAADGSKGLIDTATRIEDNVPLNNGERVRIGLESLSHRGYVYIIDREKFADGSLGEGYLIFPSTKIDGGKNWALPGLQIHLPRADGCFCVKSRNTQRVLVADVLTVILSPTPLLSAREIGVDAVPIPVSLGVFLDRGDKEKTFRAILRDGRGLAQSSAEQNAGTKGLLDTEPVLTQSDLPPQTFYQSIVPIGKAAVFNFSIRYGGAGN